MDISRTSDMHNFPVDIVKSRRFIAKFSVSKRKQASPQILFYRDAAAICQQVGDSRTVRFPRYRPATPPGRAPSPVGRLRQRAEVSDSGKPRLCRAGERSARLIKLRIRERSRQCRVTRTGALRVVRPARREVALQGTPLTCREHAAGFLLTSWRKRTRRTPPLQEQRSRARFAGDA